jgi:hypothetical protein
MPSRIRITQNIPTYNGSSYPNLGVVGINGGFPLAAELSDRKAGVQLVVQPYRLVQDGDNQIYLKHPDISRAITLAGLAIEDFPLDVGILPLAAQLIAANIAEWSTAEVIDG